MADPIVNFFKSTLVGTYSDTDTSFTIATGDGALLPDPATDGEYNLTIFRGLQVNANTTFEIVRVTARSGDVLTVTREQEGTTALTVDSEVHSILMSATKKTFDDINTAIDSIELADQTLNTTDEVEFLKVTANEVVALNGLKLPVLTTATRPSNPVQGLAWFNSDETRIEIYDGEFVRGVALIEIQTSTTIPAEAIAQGVSAEALDLTPYVQKHGAKFAYSVRQLSPFAKHSMRVRRSNDNAEQDIGFDANGNLDESALTSFVGNNDGFVVKMYNQSHATKRGDIQGAVCGFSLFKISDSYTGDCMRVRRSSDNAEQDIGFDSSGKCDYSAILTFVGSGDGFVTRMYDQIDVGEYFQNTTSANQFYIAQSGQITKSNFGDMEGLYSPFDQYGALFHSRSNPTIGQDHLYISTIYATPYSSSARIFTNGQPSDNKYMLVSDQYGDSLHLNLSSAFQRAVEALERFQDLSIPQADYHEYVRSGAIGYDFTTNLGLPLPQNSWMYKWFSAYDPTDAQNHFTANHQYQVPARRSTATGLVTGGRGEHRNEFYFFEFIVYHRDSDEIATEVASDTIQDFGGTFVEASTLQNTVASRQPLIVSGGTVLKKNNRPSLNLDGLRSLSTNWDTTPEEQQEAYRQEVSSLTNGYQLFFVGGANNNFVSGGRVNFVYPYHDDGESRAVNIRLANTTNADSVVIGGRTASYATYGANGYDVNCHVVSTYSGDSGCYLNEHRLGNGPGLPGTYFEGELRLAVDDTRSYDQGEQYPMHLSELILGFSTLPSSGAPVVGYIDDAMSYFNIP